MELAEGKLVLDSGKLIMYSLIIGGMFTLVYQLSKEKPSSFGVLGAAASTTGLIMALSR